MPTATPTITGDAKWEYTIGVYSLLANLDANARWMIVEAAYEADDCIAALKVTSVILQALRDMGHDQSVSFARVDAPLLLEMIRNADGFLA